MSSSELVKSDLFLAELFFLPLEIELLTETLGSSTLILPLISTGISLFLFLAVDLDVTSVTSATTVSFTKGLLVTFRLK